MTSFQRYKTSQLYPSSEVVASSYLAYFLLDEVSPVPDSISYNDSWSEYIGVYVFSAITPATEQMEAFVQSVISTFSSGAFSHTSLAWVELDTSTGAIKSYEKLAFTSISSPPGIALESRYSTEILNNVFNLEPESDIVTRKDTASNLDGLIIQYPLSKKDAPVPVPSQNVIVPLTGSQRGCISAEISLNETGLRNNMSKPHRGFYYFITKEKDPGKYLSQYYPLFPHSNGMTAENSPPDTEVYSGYRMVYDPLSPYHSGRTRLTYLGFAYQIIKIADPPYRQIELVDGPGALSVSEFSLESNFRTVFGDKIKIAPIAEGPNPGGYVLNQLPPDASFPYYMAPVGDYRIIGETAGDISMACGLSGTEFFVLQDDNGQGTDKFIRFSSDHGSVVKNFPFDEASPVKAPFDPTASPFHDDFTTSFATLVSPNSPGTEIPYISQPKGAALFGVVNHESPPSDLLEHAKTALTFEPDGTKFFPMVPYAGLDKDGMSNDDMQALESTVLSKQRHATIITQTPPKVHLNALINATSETHYSTTPSGLLVKTTQDPNGKVLNWDWFLLGQNGNYQLLFNDPPEPVVSVMQSSNVFMVGSNSNYLGSSVFQNEMGIGDWKLKVDIGTNQKYGDYRNLMIIKGRKGKLYDPNDIANCLVANPKKWNQADDFSNPQMDPANPKGDQSQLIILSNYLQEYFENAFKQTSDYFNKFNTIATDENWTGILFLRVDIDSLPTNLSGIVAGVTDPSSFNAHHLGIEISPIQLGNTGVPALTKPSSMFGLIYYQDQDFSDKPPVKSIAPSDGDTYNFRLLSLKVLFENTAVKSFESYAQLTLNQLFDSSISKTLDPDNIYKNVLLAGSLQINNGKPVYSLSSQKEDAFYLQNNVINKIEITDLYLSSRSGEDAAEQINWFGMTGYIDFNILNQKVEVEESPPSSPPVYEMEFYDLLSFGNLEGEDKLRKGLHFSNLGIEMKFPKDAPTNSTLSFAPGQIQFDPSPTVSTPRPGSLYLQLGLSLQNLVVGKTGESPKDSGYLDMVSDIRLSGPGQTSWYGLRFKLNMGTPGALADNVGLNAYILASWSPFSGKDGATNYDVGIGIKLPGSGGNGKLLSLQSVLKLSIGQILLRLVPTSDGLDKTFMLVFTDIALKFLGLLKIPPGGNTMFYLFGDPKGTGDNTSLGWYAMYRQDEKKKIETINVQSN